jgi:hypothetical protein
MALLKLASDHLLYRDNDAVRRSEYTSRSIHFLSAWTPRDKEQDYIEASSVIRRKGRDRMLSTCKSLSPEAVPQLHI